MFTISVAMIIKDEELTLSRILDCATQFADEIIIVDTGSKDNSKKIAQRYTNLVFDYQWNNNFANARNYAFEKATKDYIMWLDADDHISKENINKILNIKNTTTSTDVFMMKYYLDENFEFYRERLVKNNKSFVWQGAVHEVITPSGEIKYLDITIEHKKIKATNPKRNLNIYRKLIKDNQPFDARMQHYYARELYYNNYIKSSIRAFKKHIKMNDQYFYNTINSYLMLADCYIILKDYTNAIKYLFQALLKFVPNAEICCKIGECFEKINKIDLSIYWYENALISPTQTQGFIKKDYQQFIPSLELCRLYYHKNYEISKKFYKIAQSLKPNHPSIIYNKKFFD